MSSVFSFFKFKEAIYLPVHQETDSKDGESESTAPLQKRQSLRTAASYALRSPSLGLCLLGLNITLLLVLLVFARNASRQIFTLTDYRSLNSIVPQFESKVRVFQPDHSFWNTDSGASNAAWEKIGGPSAPGFLVLDALKEENDSGVFGISVLHQLHCLSNIRGIFLDFLHDRVDGETLLQGYHGLNDSSGIKRPDTTNRKHDLKHILHCFDYVRQGIECTADMSLEIPHKKDVAGTIDGWGHAHLCRKWDDVWAWFEDHRSFE